MWEFVDELLKICHLISRWSIRWSIRWNITMKYSMKFCHLIVVMKIRWRCDEVLSLNCCDEDSMKSKKSCEKIIKHVTNIVSWFANTFVEMNNPHHEVCRWRFYRRVCWSVCWRCVSVCLLKMWWRKGWSMLLK